jgi:hypothetical protein
MTYRLGFELEIPWETGEAPPEQSIGVLDTVGQSTLRDTFHDDTEVTWERIGGSQYGYELRTQDGGVRFHDAPDIYRESLAALQEQAGVDYNPVGLTRNTTAGLHIHISGMSEADADALYRLSHKPAVQLLCGSTIAIRDSDGNRTEVFAVGRREYSGYCNMDKGTHHNDVVNTRNLADGHYEWRLPEPMDAQHFVLVKQFIGWLDSDGEQAALEFARNMTHSVDERITAIRRAKMCRHEFKAATDTQSRVTPATRYLYALLANETHL